MGSSLTVVRWRKWGKDRLYVSTADGVAVGWHDLVAGESHPENPELADEFAGAVSWWLASQRDTEPGGPAEPPPGGPLATPLDLSLGPASAAELVVEIPVGPSAETETSWDDLADRLPGAAARERAVALREAAPVKTVITRVLGMKTDERAWRIGADGEEKVATRLARLAQKDPSWRFIHAIPVGENGSDIDHLVIGPGGVFTLNAKHHPGANIWVGGGTFMANGQRVPYVRNSRHEAQRAAKLLADATGRSVAVTGVIVPVGASEITIKTAPREVHIVNRMRLTDWLRKRPIVLDDVAITAIYEAARRSTTWHANGRPIT